MRHHPLEHVVAPIALGASLLIAPSLALASASRLDGAQLDAVSAGLNVHLVTGMPGQPSQTIGTDQTGSATPGNAADARGSAFNPDGIAGAHYAGSKPVNPAGNLPHNSVNPKSVAQYDVAGFQQSHNH
jgi:hypothetical protein